MIDTNEWHDQYGTCRRGNGEKVHFGHRSYKLDENGKQTFIGIGAICNSNGQHAGRDFQEGTDREVTCTTCNPTAPRLSPSERTPKADSCTAINKRTGKQCTFKGYEMKSGDRRCNNHK